MAEARLIYKKVLASPDFVRLNDFEQVIFISLIITADDWGRLPGDIRVLRGIVMPCSDRPTADLVSAVRKLEKMGMVRWEEGYALEIVNFGKYQKAYHRRRMTGYLFSAEKSEGQGKVDERSDKDLLDFPTEKTERGAKGQVKVDESSEKFELEKKRKEKKEKKEGDKDCRTSQYKIKNDDLSKVVYGFKIAQGFKIDDRDWDKSEWGRTSRAAKELLDFFDGDVEKTLRAMEDIIKALNDKRLSWTPQTVSKWKLDWRRQIEKWGKYNDLGKGLIEGGDEDVRF